MPSTPACTLTPEQEEGPYYVDYDKFRSDIGEGKPGVPLTVRLAVMDAKRCMPLSNATLDIWHCDAQGVYSGFTANGGGFGPRGGRGPRGGFPPGPPPNGAGPDGPPSGDGPPPGYGPPLRGGSARGHHALDETRFLRGSQTTNAAGTIEFRTIYPGWYEGRTIHIHMKVHTGGHVSHTGQLFFPEDVTLKIAKQQPYAKHLDTHLTTLSEDHVYEDEHGAAGMVTLSRAGEGYMAMATLAVDPEATPKPVGMGRPGGPGFGPGPGPRR
jgi:protocatechuate 3,4-dioxygenase beta subunit